MSTDDCLTQPKGAREAFGMKCKAVIGSGKAKPRSMSSLMIDLKATKFFDADW
jgi:hypothetical protein